MNTFEYLFYVVFFIGLSPYIGLTYIQAIFLSLPIYVVLRYIANAKDTITTLTFTNPLIFAIMVLLTISSLIV